MNERLAQYRAKAVQYWNQTTRTQKIALISSVVLLILVLIITVYNLSRTEYSVAFTDLNASDAAEITAYLSEQGIPYKISDDGRSIGVPTKDAAMVKINVESQGLLQNGSLGYGIFKENLSGFGMTDNEFDVLRTDALAGEIQQLINGLNGVSKSKVLIYLPQESVFLSETTGQPSASAVITFKPGFRPDQKMIDTIYNLVAHSLPNIDMENITISDQSGELLPSSKIAGGFDSAAGQVAQQFAIKKQFENDIQRNVHNLLGNLVGKDKVAVSVIANLNFDKKNSVEQLVMPVNPDTQRGIEISVETIQETYSSEGGDAAGVVGTGPDDIPGYVAADGSGGRTESESLTERINYDVNRISNEIISAPFQVVDLTINVAVEPPVKDDPSSLTEETINAIQRILSNIVAASLADSGRSYTQEEIDNKVFVLAHSFDGVEAPEERSIWTSPVFAWLAAALLAVVLIGAILLYRRKKAEEAAMLEEAAAAAATAKPEAPVDLEIVAHQNQVRRQLEHLAKRKPEEFVNLLRTWLVDE